MHIFVCIYIYTLTHISLKYGPDHFLSFRERSNSKPVRWPLVYNTWP